MKPKEIMTPLQSAQAYLLDVEHELADANDRIRLLIAERNTARLQADQKINLREEFRELLGTDDIKQGVVVVRELQDRIKRLEEALSLITINCEDVHHSKKHRHGWSEPCPVVELISKAKEAKP
jgi:hypothetical protein